MKKDSKHYCITCRHFCQYYIKYKETYKPVTCGFCTNEQLTPDTRKKFTSNLNACDLWIKNKNATAFESSEADFLLKTLKSIDEKTSNT